MANDPHAYLGHIRLPKGVSKAAELNASSEKSGRIPVRAHERSTPMPNERRLAVKSATMATSGSSHGVGALGSGSEGGTRMAKRANIEGNESPTYEKLEKRTLRGLKEGGSEKELRAGHNFGPKLPGPLGGLFGGDSGPSAAERRTAQKKANVRTVTKSGIGVDAAKNPVLAAKVARRQGIKTARATGGDVKAARQAATSDVQAAKKVRAGFTGAERKASRQSYHQTVKAARKALK